MNDSNGNAGNAVLAVTNSISVMMCLLAVILVIVFKLHKIVVYRLALYQVLASLTLATVAIVETILVNYVYSKNPDGYGRICTTMAFLTLYIEWVKLLFTMWVTFHLFCFAVLHKNLKKLEVMYIVTSLVIPAVIAVVPLITKTYGHAPGTGYCSVYVTNNIAVIERYVLWDGPAMLILIVASTAMFVMVVKISSHACLRTKYESVTNDDQFRKALKQLLPLATFPILFFVFEIPVFTYHVQVDKGSITSEGLQITVGIGFFIWSMASGTTLVIHISLAQICGRKKRNRLYINERASFNQSTAKLTLEPQMKSTTNFSFPPDSV